MSEIYRPRHQPYIPPGLSAALIQSSEDENNLPAVFKKIQRVYVAAKIQPYFRPAWAALIQTAQEENDVPAIFANKWKLLSSIYSRPTHSHYDFRAQGNEPPIPPVPGIGEFRPGRGGSPKTQRYPFRPSLTRPNVGGVRYKNAAPR